MSTDDAGKTYTVELTVHTARGHVTNIRLFATEEEASTHVINEHRDWLNTVEGLHITYSLEHTETGCVICLPRKLLERSTFSDRITTI